MKMDPVKKSYTNGEVTVFWEPDLCNHAAICFRSLPNVFKPGHRPWIDLKGASNEEIIKTVKRCPTKALYYELNDKPMESKKEEPKTIITILQDGPYLIDGSFKVIDNDGNEVICDDGIALCRCGASKKKPFCDGEHTDINFKD
jgi:uncharacterized Fe-S cluster protein YjdI